MKPICLHCQAHPESKETRGLCITCHRNKAIRALYPKRKPGRRPDTIGLCRHCQRRLESPGRRGLCSACYYRPRVRGQYQAKHGGNTEPRREPADAEVEAMVAEQLKCLPAWWKEPDEPAEPREPKLHGRIVRTKYRRNRKAEFV